VAPVTIGKGALIAAGATITGTSPGSLPSAALLRTSGKVCKPQKEAEKKTEKIQITSIKFK
jgi:bifunctional N-acetylglucosamine-1-phosphate-uridyltransferase/glucosamine-1-phosphate-acetyltransferase GlmU-like protein